MKVILSAGAILCLPTTFRADVPLPAESAGALASGSVRGFLVRVAQASQTNVVGNSVSRAIKQLNGTLRDNSGAAVPDESIPGPNADGSYRVDTINFEKDGASPMDLTDDTGAVFASFNPSLFAGIPGQTGHADNFAVEVIGFLELSAGSHLLGISVSSDRTDVNDDDTYQLFVGANPRDFFNMKVAEYQRAGAVFGANQHIENQFTVEAPVAGIYPFRLVYVQTGLGANLQFYSVDAVTTERILVNDPNDARAIVAYTQSSVAKANAPAVVEVSPFPGSDGVAPAAPITALLLDGKTTVATSKIKMYLNNAAVIPQKLTKTSTRLSVQYDPNASRKEKNNLVRLEYTDSTGAAHTNIWSFGILVSGGLATTVTGQWDFNKGDLSATIGKALQYFDGPDNLTKAGTEFGTTIDLGVPDIQGVVANIMKVPGDLSPNVGYLMDHGIAPNGGGTRVNQWTLIMDILVDTSGPGAASLIQVSSYKLNNKADGDLFWQGNNFGQGNGGYNGLGAFTAGEWHRLIAAYDEAAKPPAVTKFVDGIKQDDWTANQGLDAARRTLLPYAVLFADGQADERRVMWVSSIQIRSGKLSDTEMSALGGASPSKIPVRIPGVQPPEPPRLTISIHGDTVTIGWPSDATGYSLESTPRLTNPAWVAVAGTTNNLDTVQKTTGTQFFRLTGAK